MFTAVPIGVVRSSLSEGRMPPMGVPAAIEIFPPYFDGLLHLEKHSHIWVFGWFDHAGRDLLRVVPRGIKDAKWGVFAVRSPARPNPIGLTVTRVARIDPPRIEVDLLDFLNGTPVLDIKPYLLNRDLIFSAANVQIGRPSGRGAMRESLLLQAERFHGERCGGLALAVRIIEHFRAAMLDMRDAESWRLSVPLKWPCLVDGLMGLTRATPGRGKLRFRDDELIELSSGEQGTATYHPLAIGAEYARILEMPDDAVFALA